MSWRHFGSVHSFLLNFVWAGIVERSALVDIYSALGGVQWKDSTGWLEGDPCEDGWLGVTCADNVVTKLSLADNDLKGNLPDSLEALQHLQVLSLDFNEISGTIPTFLGRLTDLEIIYLHNNGFEGTVPKQLESLHKLQHLGLANNYLSGSFPSAVSSLPNLVQMSFEGNAFENTPTAPLGLDDGVRYGGGNSGQAVEELQEDQIEAEEADIRAAESKKREAEVDEESEDDNHQTFVMDGDDAEL